MIRGTTPTITMELPCEVSVAEIASAIVSIEQSGKEKITKTFPEITKDTGANTLAVKLTQEESLSLSSRNKAIVQLKVKTSNGTVLASHPTPIVVTDIINKEVM